MRSWRRLVVGTGLVGRGMCRQSRGIKLSTVLHPAATESNLFPPPLKCQRSKGALWLAPCPAFHSLLPSIQRPISPLFFFFSLVLLKGFTKHTDEEARTGKSVYIVRVGSSGLNWLYSGPSIKLRPQRGVGLNRKLERAMPNLAMCVLTVFLGHFPSNMNKLWLRVSVKALWRLPSSQKRLQSCSVGWSGELKRQQAFNSSRISTSLNYTQIGQLYHRRVLQKWTVSWSKSR